MHDGDLKARETIIKYHIDIVIKHIQSYDAYDKQELVAIGMEALIRAVDNYDMDRNIKFTTYLINCVNYAIKKYYTKVKRHNIISLNDIPNDIIDSNGSDLDKELIKAEEITFLKEQLSLLSDRDALIIKLYFYDNYSQEDIAAIVGVGRAQVSKIIKKILLQIKRKYDGPMNIQSIDEIINSLDEGRDKEILILYLKNGYTQMQIADMYELNQSTINAIINKYTNGKSSSDDYGRRRTFNWSRKKK